MAPSPLSPLDPTVPVLDDSLSAKTIAVSISKLYLGQNTVVADSNNGIQTNLPFATTNLMYASGYRITSGATYDYFNSDNFKIDSLGGIDSKGTIKSTSTGVNSLAGSLTVTSAVSSGSVTVSGALSAGSASVTGALSAGSISSGAITSSATMTANNLKITSANLAIDSTSATNSITLNGELKVNAAATGASVFKLDSTTGEMQTYGNISTTGTGNITAGGALSCAALNVGTLFKVDGFGAMTVKDAGATQAIYSFDKNGNFFTSGSLTAPGTATLASGKLIIEGASGNLATQGTISSGNVAVSGSLKTTGVVNIGGTDASPAIQLSNNGTSYLKNSLQIGDASNQKSVLNADGTASFATGNFTVAATGDVVAKGTASFGNNAVALGYTQGSVPANAKVSVDSDGNVAVAGTLAVAGNSTLTGTLAVASNKLTVNASGDLATAGVLFVSGGKLTVNAAGNFVSQGTISAANGNFTVDASGNVEAKGTMNFAGNSTMSGALDLTGDTKMGGKLDINGAVTATSTLSVTGATTLSSTLAVTGDLAVNTDKFKVIASSGDATMLGNLTVGGNANFSGNQIQLKSDGSLYAQNYLQTDFAVANYVKSSAAHDTTTTSVPEVGSAAETALFNSSTNKYLTTQEYVDRAVFKQTARLNLITKDVDANLATFNNFSKVLAAIEGSDAATIINGLVDSVDDVKVSVSDVMTSGYNSVVISCVPSVWGDAAAPEPIPTPISNIYKEDGWFYSNLASDSKINWYLPAYSGMKMKDITNLFMNNFLLSTVQLPKITIYTAPKNNSIDAILGVYNAKIEYYFSDAQPTAVTAQRSCLYVINAPRNVYSDKTHDIKCGYSITSNGSSAPVQTTFTPSTTFSTSFAASKVTSEDSILTFAVETSESTIKDYMFILQSFNISTKNGTTQMLFQNSSVVIDYLFKYFFRQNTDFSDISLYSNNLVNRDNYTAYIAGILGNLIYPSSAVTNISPQSYVTGFKILSIGGTQVVSENQIINFPADTPSALLVCDLENNNNSLVITRNGSIITNTVGDYTATTPLTTGDNTFVVTVKDVNDNTHTKKRTFVAKVFSTNTSLSTITVTPQGGSQSNVTNGQTITLPSGVTSVVVAATGYTGANVEIDGEIGTTSSSKTITVPSGTSKVVNIIVTATDGVTQNSYSVTIVARDNTPVLNEYVAPPSITSLQFYDNTYTAGTNDDFEITQWVGSTDASYLTPLTVNTSSNGTLKLDITSNGSMYFSNNNNTITISQSSTASNVTFSGFCADNHTIQITVTNSNSISKTYTLKLNINYAM